MNLWVATRNPNAPTRSRVRPWAVTLRNTRGVPNQTPYRHTRESNGANLDYDLAPTRSVFVAAAIARSEPSPVQPKGARKTLYVLHTKEAILAQKRSYSQKSRKGCSGELHSRHEVREFL